MNSKKKEKLCQRDSITYAYTKKKSCLPYLRSTMLTPLYPSASAPGDLSGLTSKAWSLAWFLIYRFSFFY